MEAGRERTWGGDGAPGRGTAEQTSYDDGRNTVTNGDTPGWDRSMALETGVRVWMALGVEVQMEK